MRKANALIENVFLAKSKKLKKISNEIKDLIKKQLESTEVFLSFLLSN
jgi:hypothetical protein